MYIEEVLDHPRTCLLVIYSNLSFILDGHYIFNHRRIGINIFFVLMLLIISCFNDSRAVT
jgi:hypothetical protein